MPRHTGKAVVAIQDAETRERLLTSATRLFAERGFAKVTVRDICADAAANVAAVNYHFNGKVGLYEEILNAAVRIMRSTTEEMREAGAGLSLVGQLEAGIGVFIERVTATCDTHWIHQLMLHEMANPTPSFDVVVDEVIKPRHAYLSEIIAGMLGCPVADRRVWLCLLSVQAQILFAVKRNPIADRLEPAGPAIPTDAVARHIARFSVAGIEAMKTQKKK